MKKSFIYYAMRNNVFFGGGHISAFHKINGLQINSCNFIIILKNHWLIRVQEKTNCSKKSIQAKENEKF